MPPRSVWKGFLQVGELTCPVSLYTAVSASDRIAFHTLNRATQHRVHRQFVDSESGELVPREDQVKGYAVGQDDYVILEPEEVAAAVPESDKVLSTKVFVPCREIDDVYFDRPYYLVPTGKSARQAYGLICEGLLSGKVAALAQAVLFRRVRTLLVRSHDGGLIATLLNFDYEVRSANEAFDEVPDLTIKAEMLELAEHIIKTKRGTFDPKTFDDRYENAVAEMVRAKIEGRPMKVQPKPASTKVVDLMEALRLSAKGASTGKGTASAKTARAAGTKSKAKPRSEIPAVEATPRRKRAG